jgi:hypothetical protein
MTLVIVALCWALPSFLLHNTLHEGAHALAAKMAGCTDIRLYPFPGRKLGYFTWAHMRYSVTSVSTDLRWISIAPVTAESLWLLLGLLLLFLAPIGWWSGVLLVEPISATIDLLTWMLGFWRPVASPDCDAEVHRNAFGFSRAAGKLYSLLLLPPAALVVYGAIRLFR